MNISISPLTLEIKIRYASAFLFLGFFVMILFSIDPLGIGSSNETGLIFSLSIYPFILLLLWSLFNRWYFMVPAMTVLVIIEFFTVTLAIVHHSHLIEDNELSIPIILFVEGLAFVSFGMYVHRNIKSNNRSVYFNLGIRIISCIIVILPVLVFYISDIIASMT